MEENQSVAKLSGRLKDRLAAVLLALFGGLFGVHRFYLGQWWGIFYLLFFWTYIPALVALIEAIVFAFTKQEVWDEKHNNGVQTSDSSSNAPMIIIAIAFAILAFIFVVGILAAIAIPQFAAYREKAFCQSIVGDLAELAIAQEAYYVDNNQYADSINIEGFSPTDGVDVNITEADSDSFRATAQHSSCLGDNGDPKTVIWDSGKGGLQN